MPENTKMVPMDEAAEQVRVTAVRLALMHIAFARTLVEELGEKKGKETALKAIMEYGRMVGERNRAGAQDMPHYGLHRSYAYGEKAHVDGRDNLLDDGEAFDYSRFKVHGCTLAEVFLEYDEPELGCLYCYVDAAKSMGADPSHKLVHTKCELLGDDCCSFKLTPTSQQEQEDFRAKNLKWKDADPILVKGSKIDKA
jgi:L-2-amino-thiazoline-4-carboxylic acid hydrolase-like protein